jgi:hypothetical protein
MRLGGVVLLVSARQQLSVAPAMKLRRRHGKSLDKRPMDKRMTTLSDTLRTRPKSHSFLGEPLSAIAAREDLCAADSPLDTERRRSAREPFFVEAFVWPPDIDPKRRDAEKIEVSAVNLSRHGIAFDVDRPLPEGTDYLIEVGVGSQTMTCEVRTVSCVMIAEGLYEVGAEFV